MIEEFINSALIIDDKEEDINDLKELLESKDIWVKHFFPKNLGDITTSFKNRKIIFLDLFISETSTELAGNISEIRAMLTKIVGLDFGNYGIVLWSAHTDEIEQLKSKIQLDALKYSLPAFIVGLNKKKYLESGNYNDLLVDLDDELSKNTAAKFFINWDSLVRTGKDNTIKDIYSLANNYSTQEEDLKFILSKLAQNYAGIPEDKQTDYNLEHDAVKAFSDMLNYEVVTNFDLGTKIFDGVVPEYSGSPEDKLVIFAKINSKILLDSTNITQNLVLPGNVYEIIDSQSSFKIDGIPQNAVPVAIEVTPPCDFSNKNKVNSRLIGGFIVKYSKNMKDKFKKEYHYKEIWPILIKGSEEVKLIIFDFRYFGSISEDIIKDVNNYKILFRTKDKLFADILQKLSSHTARLGLSVIHS